MESLDDDKDNNDCAEYDDTIGSDGTTTVEHGDDEDIQEMLEKQKLIVLCQSGN